MVAARWLAARLRPTDALFGGLPGLELYSGRELLWLETPVIEVTSYPDLRPYDVFVVSGPIRENRRRWDR